MPRVGGRAVKQEEHQLERLRRRVEGQRALYVRSKSPEGGVVKLAILSSINQLEREIEALEARQQALARRWKYVND